MDDKAAAANRMVRRLKAAIAWIGAGFLVYLLAAVVVLNQVRLPARLPGWSIVFFLPVVAVIFGIPLLRSRVAHYRGVAAQAQLDAALRSVDELEREQNKRRRS